MRIKTHRMTLTATFDWHVNVVFLVIKPSVFLLSHAHENQNRCALPKIHSHRRSGRILASSIAHYQKTEWMRPALHLQLSLLCPLFHYDAIKWALKISSPDVFVRGLATKLSTRPFMSSYHTRWLCLYVRSSDDDPSLYRQRRLTQPDDPQKFWKNSADRCHLISWNSLMSFVMTQAEVSISPPKNLTTILCGTYHASLGDCQIRRCG